MSDTAAWSPVAGPPKVAVIVAVVAVVANGCSAGERVFSVGVCAREARTGYTVCCCGRATTARERRSHIPTRFGLAGALDIIADPGWDDWGTWVAENDADSDGGRSDDDSDDDVEDGGAKDSGRLGNGVWTKNRPIVQSRWESMSTSCHTHEAVDGSKYKSRPRQPCAALKQSNAHLSAMRTHPIAARLWWPWC
ncbi:hypothetical protein pkur_cds_223 [Pandoravirus kuranda]|uniref:Uncharacterized protein n=1 Tax=Pandoravirus kuranda TaxID=3019033 RepID=A0AA95J467_9VIRU|nr:hypothetical protein pkur_cds_223 [Pandoravirus kuranda]